MNRSLYELLAEELPRRLPLHMPGHKRSGLLARTPHLQHGRIQQLSLSPAGAALLAEAKTRVARLEQELAAPLAEEELLLVKRWLANLASGMEGEA